MSEYIEPLLDVARSLAREELPRFLGDIETVRAIAWSRLTVTAPLSKPANDELIDVEEAARRLGVSSSFLYRNHGRYTFSRRVGRSLRFSSQGLQAHIEQAGVLTPRRRGAILTPASLNREDKDNEKQKRAGCASDTKAAASPLVGGTAPSN